LVPVKRIEVEYGLWAVFIMLDREHNESIA
jgi:hypothetical protein